MVQREASALGTAKGPPGARTRWRPLVGLLLAASIFPEVLSLSTPVPLLFSPPGIAGFAMFVGMYGCGAVLVWEAITRWQKGWLAVLPLGAAYGIAEEGLATKVFDDPSRQQVVTGIPGAYGSWQGVEWATFVPIDMFHAVVSIGAQVLLVSLLFPEVKGSSIVSTRGLLVVGAAFAADIGLQFFTVDPNPLLPLLPGVLVLAGLAMLFLLLARWSPANALARWMRSPTPTSSPRVFFLVAFGWLLSLLVVFQIGSHLIPSAGALVVFDLLSGSGALYFLLTRSGWKENRRHQVAFLGGMAGAFAVWDASIGVLIGDGLVLVFAAIYCAIVVMLWRRSPFPVMAPRPSPA